MSFCPIKGKAFDKQGNFCDNLVGNQKQVY